jgi:cysteinyl-tRNA synthetase
MAKSKGNFYTLRDLLAKGHDPVVIRYLLISVPYRQKLNFTMDGLHAAEQAMERIDNTLRRLEHTPLAAGAGDLEPAVIDEFRRQFRDSLGDDLNTARALGALHTVLRHVNTALDGGGISDEANTALRQALDEADSVLGIFPAGDTGAGDDDEIQRLVDERTAARTNEDFARADELRDRLTEMGIVVEDTPHGAVWHRKN